MPILACRWRHGGQFGTDAPDQDGLGAAGLGPQQLGGHVLVADVELLLGHHRQLVALLLDLVQQVVPAGNAVVGGVVDHGHFRESAVDGLLHHHGRLDAVVGGEAEDGEVLHAGLAPLGHGLRAGGRADDLGDALFLQVLVAGHDDAGVDGADHAGQVAHGGQFLGDEGAALVLGLVVPLDDLDLHLLAANLDAARGIDLGDGQLGAVAGGCTHGRRAARKGAGEGDLDRASRLQAQGREQQVYVKGGSEHSFLLLSCSIGVAWWSPG